MKNKILREWIDRLGRELPDLPLRRDVPYTEITTLGVGSTLPFLAEPVDAEQLRKLLQLAHANHIETFYIGAGSNLIGSDAPCPRLGIRLAPDSFQCLEVLEDGRIRAGGLVRLPQMIRRAAEAGWGGLGALSGIPGTLGGALRMNAGAGGTEIGACVLEVSGLHADGSGYHAKADELKWSYRASSIPADVIITEAELQLSAVEPEKAVAEIEAELRRRREREPRGRTAGCMFRNVSVAEPAGRLIDDCGLKGFAIGGIRIAEEHGNYAVNAANGPVAERDFLTLLAAIRRQVAERHGFYLEPEVRFLNERAVDVLRREVPAPEVNVLYGGSSGEREVSLRSGAAVSAALRNAGCEVVESDLTECRFSPDMAVADVVFPVLHGGWGEDGTLQKIMEEKGLRFVGSGSEASLLIMDKIASKRLMDRLEMPTAKWAVVTPADREFPEGLRLPVILKAPMEGSTLGIVKVERLADWPAALETEFVYGSEILVEEYVEGVEITVPVVNGQVLPAVEIKSPHGFYDYDAKYVYRDGKTEYFCPVRSLGAATVEQAGRLAMNFYLATGARDILRVDFIVTADGTPYMLEGNSLPGCTATSLVPKAAEAAGISFEKMVTRLVSAALQRGLPTRPALPVPVAEAGEAGRDRNPPVTVRMPPAEENPGGLRSSRGRAPNQKMVRLCRWLFRLAIVFCAIPILAVGIQAMAAGVDGGWIFVTNGLFLLCAEFIFRWFHLMEKKP